MAFLSLSEAMEAWSHFKNSLQSKPGDKNNTMDFPENAIEFITNPTTKPNDKKKILKEILGFFYQEQVVEFLNSFEQTVLDKGQLGDLDTLTDAQINLLCNKLTQSLNDNSKILDLILACATLYIPPHYSGPIEQYNRRLFDVLYCYFMDKLLHYKFVNQFATTLILTSLYCKLMNQTSSGELEKSGELLGLFKSKQALARSLMPPEGHQFVAGHPNPDYLFGIKLNPIIKQILSYYKIDIKKLEQEAYTPINTPLASPITAPQSIGQLLPANKPSITKSLSSNSIFSSRSTGSKKRPFEDDDNSNDQRTEKHNDKNSPDLSRHN
jgi:hypothetical protein